MSGFFAAFQITPDVPVHGGQLNLAHKALATCLKHLFQCGPGEGCLSPWPVYLDAYPRKDSMVIQVR